MIYHEPHVTMYVIWGKKCEEGGIVTQRRIVGQPIGDFIEIPGGSNGEFRPMLMFPVVECPDRYPTNGYWTRYWEYEPRMNEITRQKVCVKDSGGQSVEFTTIPLTNTCKAHRRAKDLSELCKKDGPTGEKDYLLRRPEVKAFFCRIALNNTVTVLRQEEHTSLPIYLVCIGAVERKETNISIRV